MKMGITVSPWRYDADAETAIQMTITRGGRRGHAPTQVEAIKCYGILCHKLAIEWS
jgi:hypothetical protein